MISSLNQLSTNIRLDIAFIVSKLYKGNKGPTDRHIVVIKYLQRYLTQYPNLGIKLGGIPSPTAPPFYTCADASFTNDIPIRKSIIGYIIFFTYRPIFWKLKKQDLVITNTTEAEFINLGPTAKTLEQISSILNNLNINLSFEKVNRILYTNNNNAKNRVLNSNIPARNRHIDIYYKQLIQEVERKAFIIEHLPGEEMPADGLIKPLKPNKHGKFVKLVGIIQKKVPQV